MLTVSWTQVYFDENSEGYVRKSEQVAVRSPVR
jgi:hypothetical protein